MKKIIIYLGLTVFFISSCNDELKSFGDNPNEKTTANPALLLANIEVASFTVNTGQLVKTANIFTQHLTGSDNQFKIIGTYDIKEDDFDNSWYMLYNTIMENAFIIQNQYGKDNPYYEGMAKVITAMSLSIATDLWDEVPYEDAMKGLQGVTQAKYQDQKSIYSALQDMLSEAIKDFEKDPSANKLIPGTDDIIFQGAVNKWKAIAYVLKARYALRLTKINPDSSAKSALEYITSSGISSNEDDMEAVFGGGGTSLNQWYAFQKSQGNYLKMGATFINMMSKTNDPRLPFFATKDSSGKYSGSKANDPENTKVSDIGTALASASQNIGMVTYVEAKFIQTEASFRLGNTADAQASFKEAVKASVEKVTGDTADTNFVNKVTSTLTLKNIIEQKYIALFGSLEPYNDYRRTGFPELKPNSASASSEKKIPLRLITPSNERLYNPNAVVVSNLYQPVWWDKD